VSHDAYLMAKAKWEDFVVRTWYDRNLYKKALADPAFAMQAAGIEVPPGIKVTVVAEGPAAWPFILSETPGGLSEKDALKVEANLEHPEGTCPTGGAGTAHVYERV
jgi:hypothetical protein